MKAAIVALREIAKSFDRQKGIPLSIFTLEDLLYKATIIMLKLVEFVAKCSSLLVSSSLYQFSSSFSI